MPITRRMRAAAANQPDNNASSSTAREEGVSTGTNSTATMVATATECGTGIATKAMYTTESTGNLQIAPQDDRMTAAGEHTVITPRHEPTTAGGARLPPPPASTTAVERAASIARSKKSSRSLRLAKQREELLRLQVQLATARLERIETEDSDIEDDVEASDSQQRVSEWLDDKQACLTFEGEPRDRTALPLQRKHEQHWTAPPRSAPAAPISQKNDEIPPQQKIAVNTESVTVIELAKAIAIAGRGRHHSIELPIYSGSHTEWLSFKAAYEETASSYSEVENLGRLRRSLRGNAKEAVEKLLIYSANTTDIMKTLEFRFGRPDAIALAELEQLRALARPTDTPKDICIFATKVGNIVATLRALRRQHYLYNPEVTKTTIEKLSPLMRYRWYDFAAEQSTEEADLLKLARFLEREAERCGPYAQPESTPNTTTNLTQPQRVTTGGRKPVQKTYTATEKSTCTLCNDTSHEAIRCSRFLEADSNKRWDIAKEKNLCFRCLKYRSKKHSCKRIFCGADGCERSHHSLLHFTKKETDDSEPKTETVAGTWTTAVSSTYLKMVPVRVCGPKGNLNTFALLDDGSTVTLIDAELAAKAGVKGPVEPLHIEAIANEEMSSPTSQRVTLNLEGATRTIKIRARTINNLHISPQRVTEKDLDNCQHFDGLLDQLRYNEAKPKILIGQDNWELLMSSETRRGAPHLPVASLTPLGWVLHGARTRSLGQRVRYVNHLVNIEDNIDAQLKQYFSIESLTITPRRPTSDPEVRARNLLSARTVRLPNGRYETGLLWRDENTDMPNNYENAYRRLLSIEKKIDRDPQLQQKYEEQMEALITKGYAEAAPARKHNKKTWYLPHFPVINPMKPGKVRVVHDAAAKTKGVSLNDHLLTGPDLLQSLPGVLMRLRQHRVAVSADIKEMFMQIKIREEDRDALRYLWRNKERGESPPQEYRMTSLIFGATSSPSTAIYIKNFNAARYKQSDPEACEAIEKNHYVDDYLNSFETVDKAIEISKRVRDIHREAHLELQQWTSNSQEVLTALDNATTESSSVSFNDGTQTQRVLGVIWKPNTDELAFNLNLARLPPEVLHSERPTKRETLKIVMSLFDPLGLASPITVKAKQLLQEVWRRGTGWDDNIDEDLAQQWTIWLKHLQALQNVTIQRCYIHYSDATSLQLHIFVDASELAYAAALYWRAVTADGCVYTSLVLAKAKVAPLKVTSIPRLELQAAVMGARMAAAVIEEHDRKPDSKIFWSDSRTVLTWLKTGARSYKPYVAHRIAAIEEHSTINEWRWIPTKLNVADDATRDVPALFDASHRWFRGPSFLRDDPSTWPTMSLTKVENTGEEKSYLIQNRKNITNLAEALPDVNRFSKWERLLRATARVLQFIALCRKRIDKTHYKKTAKKMETDPTWDRKCKHTLVQRPQLQLRCITTQKTKYKQIEAATIEAAEHLIIRASQQQSFKEEIKALNNGHVVATDSRLRPIAVEITNGTIVLQTRIGVTTGITERVKRPAIIDGDHHIARLYIDYVHRQLHHANVETTINECRQHYWVLRLRPTARMVIHRCVPCRIRKMKPSQPPTGNHLHNRLAHHQRPFSFTGLDYFGPLTVTVGRSTQKRYGVLFTCLTTRAVHLEIAASLTTDSAVMALRRMIARRGCPTEIWSDNGTNLHGADKELRRAIDQATEEEASKRKINWRFIPPGAPFMGGAWERLVRSVKTALNVTLQERSPSEEVLVTLLTEVEYTVNSRPLTHVSVDPSDPEVITPNHFLLGGSARTPAPGKFEDTDLIGRTHWRASQRLADIFWMRWVREYLPELQHRREPHGKGLALKLGDVVLIVDNTLPRNTWPRGTVTAVYPGTDGVVRAADVRTRGGILRRPVKKLVILPTEATAPPLQKNASPYDTDDARRENVRDGRLRIDK